MLRKIQPTKNKPNLKYCSNYITVGRYTGEEGADSASLPLPPLPPSPSPSLSLPPPSLTLPPPPSLTLPPPPSLTLPLPPSPSISVIDHYEISVRLYSHFSEEQIFVWRSHHVLCGIMYCVFIPIKQLKQDDIQYHYKIMLCQGFMLINIRLYSYYSTIKPISKAINSTFLG